MKDRVLWHCHGASYYDMLSARILMVVAGVFLAFFAAILLLPLYNDSFVVGQRWQELMEDETVVLFIVAAMALCVLAMLLSHRQLAEMKSSYLRIYGDHIEFRVSSVFTPGAEVTVKKSDVRSVEPMGDQRVVIRVANDSYKVWVPNAEEAIGALSTHVLS